MRRRRAIEMREVRQISSASFPAAQRQRQRHSLDDDSFAQCEARAREVAMRRAAVAAAGLFPRARRGALVASSSAAAAAAAAALDGVADAMTSVRGASGGVDRVDANFDARRTTRTLTTSTSTARPTAGATPRPSARDDERRLSAWRARRSRGASTSATTARGDAAEAASSSSSSDALALAKSLPTSGKLRRMRVGEVRELLSAIGIDAAGKKDHLVRRLEEHRAAAAAAAAATIDDEDEVLKERRSPRERGRMGTGHDAVDEDLRDDDRRDAAGAGAGAGAEDAAAGMPTRRRHPTRHPTRHPPLGRRDLGYDDVVLSPSEHGVDAASLPKSVRKIAERLSKRADGARTFVVGGAVRDLLLGKTPRDYDLVTNATWRSIKKVRFPYTGPHTTALAW